MCQITLETEEAMTADRREKFGQHQVAAETKTGPGPNWGKSERPE